MMHSQKNIKFCKHMLLQSVINAVINIGQELTKLVMKDEANGK